MSHLGIYTHMQHRRLVTAQPRLLYLPPNGHIGDSWMGKATRSELSLALCCSRIKHSSSSRVLICPYVLRGMLRIGLQPDSQLMQSWRVRGIDSALVGI